MSLILAAAMTLSLNVDTCILETTVLTSTLEELNTINDFMVKAEYEEDMLYTGSGVVLFFNEARDTILVREVSNGCDETYRLLINTKD